MPEELRIQYSRDSVTYICATHTQEQTLQQAGKKFNNFHTQQYFSILPVLLLIIPPTLPPMMIDHHIKH